MPLCLRGLFRSESLGRNQLALPARDRAAEDAVADGGDVAFQGDIHVGAPLTDAGFAAVEDNHAGGELALGFDIAGEHFGLEQLRVGDRDQCGDVVQVKVFLCEHLPLARKANGKIWRRNLPALVCSDGS